MKRLWAPWRLEYIARKKEGGCVFCKISKSRSDKKNLILLRQKHCFVVMNRYPYNNGHLMVIPYKHTAQLKALSPEARSEIMESVTEATEILKRAFHPDAFNVGLNMGEAAGAGIAKHLHFHIVPRWKTDTNFFPIIAKTRSMPQYLEKTYQLLLKNKGGVL
ncbi:MAG: HIT domain-containing protein [bacterium]|nr:HIT domain-containing protein [bacterium]